MRDADLRAALHQKVLRDHHGQADTLVLDELGLWYGTARVDIAVVNGRLHGYEIKSDRDTLERLPAQAQVYNNVLDRVTLVVGETHLEKAIKIVPPWWGVKVAFAGPRKAIHFREERAPGTNPAIDPVAVAALLWCDELIELLASLGAARGLRGKSRDRLTRALADLLPQDELRAVVRMRLKERSNWRVASART
ncbi:sce7726 family protein [Nannocystis exedens]|uniref:sce7726 family protein n=1 Tax=Nannocystis exedens TaxID=54 RepID=UPI000BB9FFC0|nr:sce7726 family protein [Nannocystis exedens]